MQEINKLSNTLSTIREYFRDCELHGTSSVNRTSMFWKEIFKSRTNFPNLNEMLLFRRGDYAYGIGDDRQSDLIEEENYFRRMETLFKRMVSGKYYSEVPESIFGAPYFFKMDDVEHSTSFVINSATANRIKHFIKKYSTKMEKISVCEIGAGWGGCAYQLHKILEVENYTIIDLPENLLLSSTNLIMSLSERKINCIETDNTYKEMQENTINIAVPSALPNIKAKFDLIINSFSLQEMDFESVREYMAWAQESLNETGIFVSINAHGKAGIQCLQDYRFDNFHIHHLGVFRKAPVGFFNTIPYEVVLSKKQPQDDYDIAQMNVIGELMQLGLDENLSCISNALLEGSNVFKEYLENINLFLNETDVVKKQKYLEHAKKVKGEDAVTHYIQANFYFILKRYKECVKEMNVAVKKGLTGFALFKAKILRHLCLHVKTNLKNSVITDLTGAEEELLTVYPELILLLNEGKIDEFSYHISSHVWKSNCNNKPPTLLNKLTRKISTICQSVTNI